jgi:iron(III) transport system permease protein
MVTMVWSGGHGLNSLFTTTRSHCCAHLRLGLPIAWLLARTEFKGKGWFELSALLTVATRRHGACELS